MSKELPIIISKGLSGVTSSDNPDFEIVTMRGIGYKVIKSEKN